MSLILLWTGKRRSYLDVIQGLFARKSVGWAMSFLPDSRLTIKALEMVWETSGKPTGVMFYNVHYITKAKIISARRRPVTVRKRANRRGSATTQMPA